MMRHGVLIFSLFVACGGRVDPPDGGSPSGSSSSTSSSSSSGGSAAGDFPVCPADPPNVGAACAPGEGCRYLSPSGSCAAYACTDEGRWRDAPEGC